ncbi:peptidase P60 [Burkholderia pseudomallei]
MTVTRAQFVAEARTWLHTPFKAQGRIKGVAVDCGGLLVCTGKALGLTEFDVTGYKLRMGPALAAYCEDHMRRIPFERAEAADVLLFAWNGKPMHIAIMTDREHIIHAYAPNREVVEHRLDARMLRLVHRAYSVPGVE